MLKDLAVTLCKNEQRMLFRLQHVSTLFSSICYALLFLGIYTTEYDENENLNLVSLRLWLQQILRTDLRGLRTLDGSESMSGGAKGKRSVQMEAFSTCSNGILMFLRSKLPGGIKK